MRALLDVNVLIALFDRAHEFHLRAHDWWLKNQADGWASCPLTENGFARVVSQPRYPRAMAIESAISLLRFQADNSNHRFWPDDVSLLDIGHFHGEDISGPKAITDVYLLGLAAARGGCLVTFDRRIAIAAAHRASDDHCVIL